ncbi:MAG TPA: thiamine-phosphate kinase [Dokdonella sp.]|uniref:thiamine-phosphate kinase n=1 Tax=Dokdonella sp. TaxID=2291710 RepID=UPI002D7ED8BB|nr:thiamine-phosphate kinase [Dokdonella sp.]HET9033207.1 thiamine-phosphate kinase [Dokdonella sp.]
MAEFDLIEILKQRCASRRDDVHLGIGDDAAVVALPAGHELVICTDTLVAGVHFPRETAPADIGWKSLAVNLSDLAAMGASPAWATLALTMPEADAGFVSAFADGFGALAARHDVALIGGDTTRGPLAITVTTHGFVPSGCAIRRKGAQVGDAVFVSGTLGDAAGGLRCLQSIDESGASALMQQKANQELLISRLNRPQPRVAAGIGLRGLASACIDISDGLIADLGHIAAASELGIDIEEECLPGSVALFECFDMNTCRTLQKSGGDDYELAFTIASAKVELMRIAMTELGCQVTQLGRVVARTGVRVFDRNGQHNVSPEKGWEHFT